MNAFVYEKVPQRRWYFDGVFSAAKGLVDSVYRLVFVIISWFVYARRRNLNSSAGNKNEEESASGYVCNPSFILELVLCDRFA